MRVLLSKLVALVAVLSFGAALNAAVLDYTYTYSVGPNGSYPDSTGTELNDDAVGTPGYLSPNWVGTFGGNSDPKPRIVIDFGAVTGVEKMAVNYLSDLSVSISSI